jgi:hypothetical protein
MKTFREYVNEEKLKEYKYKQDSGKIVSVYYIIIGNKVKFKFKNNEGKMSDEIVQKIINNDVELTMFNWIKTTSMA